MRSDTSKPDALRASCKPRITSAAQPSASSSSVTSVLRTTSPSRPSMRAVDFGSAACRRSVYSSGLKVISPSTTTLSPSGVVASLEILNRALNVLTQTRSRYLSVADDFESTDRVHVVGQENLLDVDLIADDVLEAFELARICHGNG